MGAAVAPAHVTTTEPSPDMAAGSRKLICVGDEKKTSAAAPFTLTWAPDVQPGKVPSAETIRFGEPEAEAKLAAFAIDVTAIAGAAGVTVNVTAIVTGALACDEETVTVPL